MESLFPCRNIVVLSCQLTFLNPISFIIHKNLQKVFRASLKLWRILFNSVFETLREMTSSTVKKFQRLFQFHFFQTLFSQKTQFFKLRDNLKFIYEPKLISPKNDKNNFIITFMKETKSKENLSFTLAQLFKSL